MHWALLLPEMDSLTLPCCSDMLVETTIPVLAQPPCPSGLVSQPRRHSVPHPYRDGPMCLGICSDPQVGSSVPTKPYQLGPLSWLGN